MARKAKAAPPPVKPIEADDRIFLDAETGTISRADGGELLVLVIDPELGRSDAAIPLHDLNYRFMAVADLSEAQGRPFAVCITLPLGPLNHRTEHEVQAVRAKYPETKILLVGQQSSTQKAVKELADSVKAASMLRPVGSSAAGLTEDLARAVDSVSILSALSTKYGEHPPKGWISEWTRLGNQFAKAKWQRAQQARDKKTVGTNPGIANLGANKPPSNSLAFTVRSDLPAHDAEKELSPIKSVAARDNAIHQRARRVVLANRDRELRVVPPPEGALAPDSEIPTHIALYRHACMRESAGQIDKAIEALEQVVALDHTFYPANWDLWRLLRSDDPARAKAALFTAIEHDSEFRPAFERLTYPDEAAWLAESASREYVPPYEDQDAALDIVEPDESYEAYRAWRAEIDQLDEQYRTKIRQGIDPESRYPFGRSRLYGKGPFPSLRRFNKDWENIVWRAVFELLDIKKREREAGGIINDESRYDIRYTPESSASEAAAPPQLRMEKNDTEVLQQILSLADDLSVPERDRADFTKVILEFRGVARAIAGRAKTRPQRRPRWESRRWDDLELSPEEFVVKHYAKEKAAVTPRPRWREGGPYGDRPAEFIAMAYAPEMMAGTLHRKLIANDTKAGKDLVAKLTSWLRSHPMPEDMDIPTYPQWNSRQLEVRAKTPGMQEEKRLDEVARRRTAKGVPKQSMRLTGT